MKKGITFFLLVIGLSLFLVACSSDEEAEQTDGTTEQGEADTEVTISEEEKADENKVVVTVNGEEVKGESYNVIYSQTKMLFQQYGQDVSDTDTIKEQAIDTIVQQQLIEQDAEQQGIEISDQMVEETITKMKENYDKEQFSTLLKDLQLTEVQLKDQVQFSLLREAYVNEEIPAVDVTDEQAQEYYDQVASQSDELPAFEEVKEQIKTQLANQEKETKLQEKVDELRDEATIETAI